MAEVHVNDGESIESALRRFKRKVLQEDIVKDIKRHAFYLKPGQKKRLKSAMARKCVRNAPATVNQIRIDRRART